MFLHNALDSHAAVTILMPWKLFIEHVRITRDEEIGLVRDVMQRAQVAGLTAKMNRCIRGLLDGV